MTVDAKAALEQIAKIAHSLEQEPPKRGRKKGSKNKPKSRRKKVKVSSAEEREYQFILAKIFAIYEANGYERQSPLDVYDTDQLRRHLQLLNEGRWSWMTKRGILDVDIGTVDNFDSR